MPFIPSFIKWINKKRINQIDLFRKYPAETQQEVLMKLLTRSRDTLWGREHGYSSVSGYEQFRNNVPLQTYEEFIPFVGRLRAGEKNLLWPGEVKWFAKSSGTTSAKSKFIPVTKESLEETHYRGMKDCLVIYTSLNPGTRIFLGKGLTLSLIHISEPTRRTP